VKCALIVFQYDILKNGDGIINWVLKGVRHCDIATKNRKNRRKMKKVWHGSHPPNQIPNDL